MNFGIRTGGERPREATRQLGRAPCKKTAQRPTAPVTIFWNGKTPARVARDCLYFRALSRPFPGTVLALPALIVKRLSPARRLLFSILLAAPLCAATPARAQTPDPAAPAPPVVSPRSETEQNLVNLPTTQPIHRFGHHFRITHRFARDLRRGGFKSLAEDFFSLDSGAVIGLDYRFAPMTNVQLGIYRSMLARTIQVSGRADAWHQGELPLALSLLASVEGTNNMRDNYAPAVGLVMSRTFTDKAAFYVSPMFVWNSAAVHDAEPADDGHEDHDHGLISPFDDGERHTAYVGLGTRVRVRSGTYVVLEFAPRLAGHSPPGRGVWGVAIERQTRGHLFQLNLSNSFGTTYGQTAIGGERSNIYLGFNLARRF